MLATILLNYHIGRIVLGSMCVGVLVWLDWSGIRVAGFSFIHLPMKMEPIVSSETSAIKSQTPGNYPKRNKLQVTSSWSFILQP